MGWKGNVDAPLQNPRIKMDQTLLKALRDIFDSLDHIDNETVSRSVACEAIGQLLDLGTAADIENFRNTCILDNSGSIACPDEKVDFTDFIYMLDFELTKFETAESKVLERIWTNLCDDESNYIVDFPPVTSERERTLRRTASRHAPSSKDAAKTENNMDIRVHSSPLPVKVGREHATEGAKVVAESIGLLRRTQPGEEMDVQIPEQSGAKKKEDKGVVESAIHTVKSLTAGGVAGATAKTVIAPFDRVKIIFQTSQQPYSFRAALLEIKWIATKHGMKSLWKGHSATLARVVPYAGIQFFSFETFKTRLLLPGEDHLTPGRRVLAGALAGITSVACTYPLDLIRARLAVSHKAVSAGAMREAMQDIVQREGVKGLSRGLSPTLLGILPYSGLAFGTFETLKQVISHRRGSKEVTTVERLVSGAFAGLVAQSCTYPLDIVRRRMQTDGVLRRTDPVEMNIGAPGVSGGGRPGFPQSSIAVDSGSRKYFTVAQTFRDVLRNEGWSRGLFKGVSMNWLKGPIAVGISFTTFDKMKKILEVETAGQ